MGLGGISIWQLLIILLIVVMIFGTKRLKNIGSDLGGAIKGFKKSMTDDDKAQDNEQIQNKEIDTDDNDALKNTKTNSEEKSNP